MTNFETTQKVKQLQAIHGDVETAKIIGLSRNTMYTRLERHNWKITEKSHIKNV